MIAVSVLSVGMALVGIALIWSAVHGANVVSTFKDLLAGRGGAS